MKNLWSKVSKDLLNCLFYCLLSIFILLVDSEVTDNISHIFLLKSPLPWFMWYLFLLIILWHLKTTPFLLPTILNSGVSQHIIFGSISNCMYSHWMIYSHCFRNHLFIDHPKCTHTHVHGCTMCACTPFPWTRDLNLELPISLHSSYGGGFSSQTAWLPISSTIIYYFCDIGQVT